MDVPNEVAAELGGIGDGVLTALRERLGCAINLRGNRLTLEGDDTKVVEAKAVVEELVDLVESGQEIGAGTVDTIMNAIDQAEDVRDIFEDVVWSHRGKRITPKTVVQKQYVDAIRKRTITFGIGPAGHRQDVPRNRARRVGALRPAGRAHHPHAPGRRGGRAARLPARRRARQGRPVHAAALRRALRHDGPGEAECVYRARHDRGRSARVHARPHVERQLHHPGRGAEHLAGADADVPHPARLRVEGRRHGRRDADRPAARAGLRPDSGAEHPGSIDGIEFVQFSHQDVVRHKLVQRIVEAYKLHSEETGTARRR